MSGLSIQTIAGWIGVLATLSIITYLVYRQINRRRLKRQVSLLFDALRAEGKTDGMHIARIGSGHFVIKKVPTPAGEAAELSLLLDKGKISVVCHLGDWPTPAEKFPANSPVLSKKVKARVNELPALRITSRRISFIHDLVRTLNKLDCPAVWRFTEQDGRMVVSDGSVVFESTDRSLRHWTVRPPDKVSLSSTAFSLEQEAADQATGEAAHIRVAAWMHQVYLTISSAQVQSTPSRGRP